MGIGNELIGDVEELLVNRVIRKQSLFRHSGQSSMAWRAEQELSDFFNGHHALLLPSATSALLLILEALDLPHGSFVAIGVFGWLANWSCIQRAGLKPLFIPVDENLNIRPEILSEYIRDKNVSVVVLAHLLGRGQSYAKEIVEICQKLNIPLLEDIAQAFGVRIGSQRAGTFGVAAWSSFNHHKILSTGDGGFVLTSDRLMFENFSALHDQGCLVKNGKRSIPKEPISGLSLRVNQLTAGVLRAQIARFSYIRARLWRLYQELSAEFIERELGNLIVPSEGDLPFSLMFCRKEKTTNYPSMLDSGWHYAGNVSWLRQSIETALAFDPQLRQTTNILASTYALGCGFTDKYFAMPLGLSINGNSEEIVKLLETLESML